MPGAGGVEVPWIRYDFEPVTFAVQLSAPSAPASIEEAVVVANVLQLLPLLYSSVNVRREITDEATPAALKLLPKRERLSETESIWVCTVIDSLATAG